MYSFAENLKETEKATEMVKAIAYPMRLRIVAMLCRRDERVNDLVAILGTSQANVSHHLRILRMSGLVATVRKGREARYTLALPHVRELIQCLERCSNPTVFRENPVKNSQERRLEQREEEQ